MTKIDIEKTKLKTEWGRLEDFFHVTPHEGGIDRYYPLSHFGTARAARQRAVHFAFQQLGMKEDSMLPEHIPQSLLGQLKDNMPPLSTQKVHLYMKHPLKISDLGRHSVNQYWPWFLQNYSPKPKFLSHTELMNLWSMGPRNAEYKMAVTDFIFKDPFTQSKEDLIKELNSDTLYEAKVWDHDEQDVKYPSFLKPMLDRVKKVPYALAERVALQRMIRYLEGEGYDGFCYENNFEDEGKLSYIAFRPEQVFNALKPESQHTIQDLSVEAKKFLLVQEQKFFESKRMMSPTERIEKLQEQTKNNKKVNVGAVPISTRKIWSLLKIKRPFN